MNRKQRRALAHDLQKKEHIKFKQAAKIVDAYYTDVELDEGTKVKLNYDLMIRHPDWKNQDENFKAYVEEHKDDVFTVEYDKKKAETKAKDMKVNVCFAEDTSDPKWLFNTKTLIPLTTAKIKMDSGEESDVIIGDTTGLTEEQITEKVNSAIAEAKERG